MCTAITKFPTLSGTIYEAATMKKIKKDGAIKATSLKSVQRR